MDRQTDGQTDGRTDELTHIPSGSIDPQTRERLTVQKVYQRLSKRILIHIPYKTDGATILPIVEVHLSTPPLSE